MSKDSQLRRILFVSHSSELDGCTRPLFDTVRFLDPEQFESRVIFPEEGTAPNLFRARGIPIERSQLPLLYYFIAAGRSRIRPFFFPRELLRLLTHARELKEVYLRFKPELVILNSPTLVASAFLLQGWKIPFVWHIREVFAEEGLWGSFSRHLARWMTSSARIVIPMSHFVARHFDGAKNVRPIWGGVDLDLFAPSGEQAGAKKALGLIPEIPTVGFCARRCEEKGFCDFVKAIFLVIRSLPSLQAIAVGEGQEEVPQALRDLRLHQVFYAAGFREDIKPFLEAMDVVVFPPPKPEGFGLALPEAMAMEKAVVATNIGPTPEIVEDGRSGILVPPNDPVRLAEAIVMLLRDPELRGKLGKEARKRIQEKFDIRKLARETQAVYEEALETVTWNA